jgi:hypothetical protein
LAAVDLTLLGLKITILIKTARKLAFCNFVGRFAAVDEQFL